MRKQRRGHGIQKDDRKEAYWLRQAKAAVLSAKRSCDYRSALSAIEIEAARVMQEASAISEIRELCRVTAPIKARDGLPIGS